VIRVEGKYVKVGKKGGTYCHITVDKSQVIMGSNGEYRTMKGGKMIGQAKAQYGRFCTNQRARPHWLTNPAL